MLKIATKLKPELAAMQTAKASGFEYAELWLNGDLLESWQGISDMARNAELQCRLHFPNRGDLRPSALSGAVALYQALSCSAMVIHRPMIERYGEKLLEQCPDLRLGVENHRLTPDEFWEWAEQNDWLTLDVEHVWMLTLRDCPLEQLLEFIEEFLTRFSHKLVHVHMPGYSPGSSEHRPMYCSRNMVLSALDLLSDFKFEGFIVSEVNPEYQNRLELQMDVLLVQRWRELCARRQAQATADAS